MGLASSQARLLNLTSRMHQIEYKAAKLEAEKLQMANESDRVYNEYLDALEKTKVQRKKLTTDGSVTYVDVASYPDFLGAGFAVVKGNVTYQKGISTAGKEAGLFKDSSNNVYQITRMIVPAGGAAAVMASTGLTGLSDGSPYYIKTKTSDQTSTYSTTMPSGLTALTEAQAWAQLKADLGITVENNFETTLTNIIQSGEVTLLSKDTAHNLLYSPFQEEFHLFETSIATNTNLQEVKDESELRRAEAKYEADMRKIDNKERKYDADLATFDNERNAIKQEMDTLKSVAKENVERTFKIFS